MQVRIKGEKGGVKLQKESRIPSHKIQESSACYVLYFIYALIKSLTLYFTFRRCFLHVELLDLRIVQYFYFVETYYGVPILNNFYFYFLKTSSNRLAPGPLNVLILTWRAFFTKILSSPSPPFLHPINVIQIIVQN